MMHPRLLCSLLIGLVFGSFNLHAQTQNVTWTAIQNLSYTMDTHTLLKESAAGWDAGATSANVLPAQQEGHIELTLGWGTKAIGFSLSNPDHQVSTIRYGFLYQEDAQELSLLYQGEVVMVAADVSESDLVRIERNEGGINYYLNGDLIHEETAEFSESLIIDLALFDEQAEVVAVQATFGVPVPMFPVEWRKHAGTYQEGQELHNANFSNAGASSINALFPGQDGHFTYVMPGEPFNKHFVGLTYDDTDAHVDDLDFAVEWSGGELSLFEGGELVLLAGAVQAGDVLKIERVRNNLYYYVNTTLLRSTTCDGSRAMYIDCYLPEAHTTLSNVQASFGKWLLTLNTPEHTGASFRMTGNGHDQIHNTGETITLTSTSDLSDVPAAYQIDYREESVSTGLSLSLEYNEEHELSNVFATYTDGNDFSQLDITASAFVQLDDQSLVLLLPNLLSFLRTNAVCSASGQRNWVMVRTFDRHGMHTSVSATFLDDFGRVEQEQSKDLETSEVLATHTVYDAYGRAALNTLPAPINDTRLCYQSDFIRTSSSDAYTASAFDRPTTLSSLPGERFNPQPVEQGVAGTLGHYYSDNNPYESHVATTDFPFVRTLYADQHMGAAQGSTQPGNHHRPGSGHEQYAIALPATGELAFLFGYAQMPTLDYRSSNGVPEILFPTGSGGYTKEVTNDADGTEKVNFYDGRGNLIASGFTGSQDAMDIRPVASYVHPLFGYVDIHIPPGQTYNTLHLDPSTTYRIRNLKTGVETCASCSLILSIAPGIYRITDLEHNPQETRPIRYDLNYYDFTLYYYDKANRLTRTVPPLGIQKSFAPSVQITPASETKDFHRHATGNPTVFDWSLSSSVANLDKIEIPLSPSSGPGEQFTTVKMKLNMDIGSLTFPPATGLIQFYDGTEPELNAYVQTEREGIRGPERKYRMQPGLADFNLHPPHAQMLVGPGPITAHFELQYLLTYDIYVENTLIPGVNIPLCDQFQVRIRKDLNGQWNVRYKHGITASWEPFDNQFYHGIIDDQLSPYATKVVLELTQVEEREQATLPSGSRAEWVTYDYTELELFKIGLFTVTHNLVPNKPTQRMPSDYDYNSLDWMLSETHPDDGKTEYVYSNSGRLRFSQNARQRDEEAFSYLNYDAQGRVLESGEFYTVDPASYGSQAMCSQPPCHVYALASNLKFQNYYGDYTTTNYTSILSGNLVDQQDGLEDAHCFYDRHTTYGRDYADMYTTTGLTSGQYRGMVPPGTVTRSASDEHTSWYGYDAYGRMAWMVQHTPGLGVQTIDYTYTSRGEVYEEILQKHVPGEYHAHRTTYDLNGRPAQTETQASATGTWYIDSESSYYLHGPLKRKTLGTQDQLQGLDFTYTVQGWLKAVNVPELAVAAQPGHFENHDPGGDGTPGGTHFSKDLFGMTLEYHSGDYQRAQSGIHSASTTASDHYSGLVKAQRWFTNGQTTVHSPSTVQHWMYEYAYDAKNQLSRGHFYLYTPSHTVSGSSVQASSQFSFDYGTEFQYDANGNLTHTERKGYEVGAVTRSMDFLNYRYTLDASNQRVNNRLEYIQDGIGSTPNYAGDLENQNTGNYQYDASGRLIRDFSENRYFVYDPSGRLLRVRHMDVTGTPQQTLVIYTYDERGFRLRKQDLVQNTDQYYVRDLSGRLLAVYAQDGGSYMQEQVPLYANSRIGTYVRDTDKRLYEITDHLGNVRAVFTQSYVTTLNNNLEGTASGYNYLWSTEGVGNHTGYVRSGSQSTRLVGQHGPRIALPVAQGDVVDASAWYHQSNTNARFRFELYAATGSLIHSQEVGASPTATATWMQTHAQYTVNVTGNGLYVVVYPMGDISGAGGTFTTNPIYYDDLSVSITNASRTDEGLPVAQLVAHHDYYPYGWEMPGRSLVNPEGYAFGYQGKFAERDPETGYLYFEARMWDARVGRWYNPDPARQFHSLYLGMGNNPVTLVDPNGELVPILAGMAIGALIGATTSAAIYATQTAATGQEWDWNSFGRAAAFGAVGGAIGGGLGAVGAQLGSFGQSIGYNVLSNVAGNSATTLAFGGEVTAGGLAGMVLGGVIGTGIGNFSGVKGGALKNIGAELGFGVLKGAITGAYGGAFGASIDGGDINEGFLQGARYGAISGGTMASMNILAFGAAYVPDKKYGSFGDSKPVYRRGHFLWPKSTGISIGRNLVTRFLDNDPKYNEHLTAHETGHYYQQSKLGFARFYARTLSEYARYGMGHTYDTGGTLEFGAQIYSLKTVGYFWSHQHRRYITPSNYNEYYPDVPQTIY